MKNTTIVSVGLISILTFSISVAGANTAEVKTTLEVSDSAPSKNEELKKTSNMNKAKTAKEIKEKARQKRLERKLAKKDKYNVGSIPESAPEGIIDPLFKPGTSDSNAIIDPLFKPSNNAIIDPLFKPGNSNNNAIIDPLFKPGTSDSNAIIDPLFKKRQERAAALKKRLENEKNIIDPLFKTR